MAKELPYFQFEPAEYLTKDISFCSMGAQGLFINLCAYYWQRGCKLTKEQLLRRLNYPNELQELIDENVISINESDINVSFLDEQYKNIIKQSNINRTNGLKGGRPKKKNPKETETKPKQNPTKSETKGIREDKIIEDNINTQSKIDLFNIFWSKYPNKVSKQKSQDKFLKLKQSEIDKILSTIDDFVNYKPFKEYNHPNPTTYLNQKRWEDELKPSNKLKFENLKPLNLTSTNHIKAMCRQPNLLQDYIKRYNTTADELRQYIKFRIDNNFTNTYEI